MKIFKANGVYTINEVAEALRVSSVTILRAIRAGRLKAVRVESQWRIFGSDLHDYLGERVADSRIETGSGE